MLTEEQTLVLNALDWKSPRTFKEVEEKLALYQMATMEPPLVSDVHDTPSGVTIARITPVGRAALADGGRDAG
jgi:hypothetical protein